MNGAQRLLHSRPNDPGEGRIAIGIGIGAFGSLVLAALLSPLRDHVPNADMALALVVPVLLGAIIGGRLAAVCSAIVAALAFDFVFTKPYNSLRIESKDDLWTFFVLLIVSLVAAEVGIRARRGSTAARESRADIGRLVRVAELSARGADADDVVSSVRAEMIGLFDLVDCVYEPAPTGTPLPRLGERGALEATPLVVWGDFVLPTGGVEIAVRGRGRDLGRLVLYAHDATAASIEKRLVAVGMADELGLTLASGSATPG